MFKNLYQKKPFLGQTVGLYKSVFLSVGSFIAQPFC